MTITEVLRLVPQPEIITRVVWSGGSDAVCLYKGHLMFRRYPNSLGWKWQPSVEDLTADDWTPVK
jgi:hypothetical protein